MSITPHDIQALTELLRRTPMSTAETLYASGLVDRLAQIAAPAPAASEPPSGAGEPPPPA